MTIWDSICHSQWFKQTSIVGMLMHEPEQFMNGTSQILFLNKNDLFEKKIEHSDIKTFFPVSSRPSSAVPPLTSAFSAFRIMMVNQGMLVVDENTSRNALPG